SSDNGIFYSRIRYRMRGAQLDFLDTTIKEKMKLAEWGRRMHYATRTNSETFKIYPGTKIMIIILLL
ncbi:hypothetical protein ACJX0J_023614, partial [Zea mays]